MPGFYIESITAHSVEKNDAFVSFGKGLNVIQGFSDTGKTCVLKCIDYIFGSTEIPFDKNTGYNSVSMYGRGLETPESSVLSVVLILLAIANLVTNKIKIESRNFVPRFYFYF